MPEIILTPSGHLRLVESSASAASGGLEPRVRGRIERAFERGQGHGVFHLGVAETDTSLPSDLDFWRGFGKLFVTRLRSLHDLEEVGARFTLDEPTAEYTALVLAAPPMTGGEYLSPETLSSIWADVESACREELAASEVPVAEFFKTRNPAWNLVGRVHFHLAEQKAEPATPFAFLATYATRLVTGSKIKHLPLGKAVAEYSSTGRSSALLSLLKPVQLAAERSEFLKNLVDSGAVFHPLSWSPAEAHAFLMDLPIYEESGIVVKVADWWRTRRSRRPLVQITVGSDRPTEVGLDALLNFSVDVTLDGETLSRGELEEILAATGDLVYLRGQWVEVDADRLRQVLSHWKAAEAATGDGLSFAESLRLLAGAAIESPSETDFQTDVEWTCRTAGPWLHEALERLRHPKGDLRGPRGVARLLREYQKVGVEWLRTLRTLGLGGCLADDMGLGKTIQVLALLEFVKRERDTQRHGPSLLVVPASLVANWVAESLRFTPDLRLFVAHGSSRPVGELRELSAGDVADADVVITTYGTLTRLKWLSEVEWDSVVLDEAQAIKNPSAKQTRAVKSLKSRWRLGLTGTPVENRLSDLWSLFDFVQPGLLGSAQAFAKFVKRLERGGGDGGGCDFAPLRSLVDPYILRRLKSDRSIISDLPEKTEVNAYCSLTRTQAALYAEGVRELASQIQRLDGIKRRGVVLSFLTRFKQICNHPAQWLGDADWDPAASGKFARLRELTETIRERQEKLLVFTQYREVTAPLAHFLATAFGTSGLVLHGSTPVRERKNLVSRFQEDESIPFFVVSLRAGGTGLNLTAASHVVHFDRWWNPAVEDQATDRAHRIGQRRAVLVHKFVCRGTVEEKVDALIRDKRALAGDLLEDSSQRLVMELSDEELMELVTLDTRSALEER